MDSNLPPPDHSTPPTPPAQVPPPAGTTPPPPLLAQNPAPRFQPLVAQKPRRSTGWMIAAIILACLLAVSMLSNLGHFVRGVVPHTSTGKHAGPRLEENIVEDNSSSDKFVVLPIEGVISGDMFERDGYGLVEFVQDQLKMAEDDDHVKAVLLKVNSPGGEVLASDDIYNAIVRFQQNSHKPVITYMGSLAASGGYYVSAPSRWIVANELTITGSIGVIMHSLNYRGLMDKVGLRPEVYKSGKFKDMLSGTKREDEITSEEKEMIQKLINETFEKFKSVVADGREHASKLNQNNKDSKGRTLSKNWADFADGRVLSGKEAYQLGFVDELGSWDTALDRAEKLAKLDHRPNLVQYQQSFSLGNLFKLFGKSEGTQIKVDLGMDLPKLQAGRLYFLSPTFVH